MSERGFNYKQAAKRKRREPVAMMYWQVVRIGKCGERIVIEQYDSFREARRRTRYNNKYPMFGWDRYELQQAPADKFIKQPIRELCIRLCSQAKRRATKRNAPFDLTSNEVFYLYERSAGRCMLTGIPFEYDLGTASRRPWAPSLDRIDSRKGYSLDNCRLVCVAVNLAMNEWGEDVLSRITDALASKRAAVNIPSDGLLFIGG